MIDRDGTLVEERNYLSSPDDLVLIARAADAIRVMRDAGLSPVVVTNQSAIGRGYFDMETLDRIHERMEAMLAQHGARVDAIYICPHVPADACECRKPSPGLARRAAREFDAKLAEAFVIGDKMCDIDLGKGVGATTILVRTGYGAALADGDSAVADYVVDDLYAAACVIRDLVAEKEPV